MTVRTVLDERRLSTTGECVTNVTGILWRPNGRHISQNVTQIVLMFVLRTYAVQYRPFRSQDLIAYFYPDQIFVQNVSIALNITEQ